MRRLSLPILLSLLLLALPGLAQVAPPDNMMVEGVPPIPQALVEKLASYQNIRSADFADWHPTKRAMLVRTRFGNTAQLHLVDHPGGARRQLTFYDEPISSGAFCLQAKQDCLVFRRDVGGAENYQLYRLDLDTGHSTLLSDGKFRSGGFLWNHAGTALVYTSVRRTGRDFDLYWMDPGDPRSEKLALKVSGAWGPLDWSPDDSRLLVIEYISINESYLYSLELSSGKLTPLTPKTEEKISYRDVRWSKDGKTIFVTTDKDSEFTRLARLDPAAGTYTYLTTDIPWDVEEFDLSDDGRYLAFVTNEAGISRLHLRDLSTGKTLPSPELPPGVIGDLKFRPEHDEFAFVLTSAQIPTDVFSYSLGDAKLTRWTYSETGGLNPETFSEAELIHFPTFDTVAGQPRQLSAFLYRPGPHFQPPYPVLIDIHGGPESQARPSFRGRLNYYTSEMGIAVLRPNVRGSAGYGKSFLLLDNGEKREDTVRDIGALLDWVAAQPEFDKTRIAVSGGSYGGYMSLATMTHFNDHLRCGIDYVGISNFVTFLENTQDYRRNLRRAEYGDERNPDMRAFLNSISPLNNADKISKPMLIAQGLNDPRVPAGESQQIRDKVRAQGGAVWYLLAKDEGHGFRKKNNADYLQYAWVFFLEKHLLE